MYKAIIHFYQGLYLLTSIAVFFYVIEVPAVVVATILEFRKGHRIEIGSPDLKGETFLHLLFVLFVLKRSGNERMSFLILWL
jgi:hypothetical protein